MRPYAIGFAIGLVCGAAIPLIIKYIAMPLMIAALLIVVVVLLLSLSWLLRRVNAR